jgi:hypothetical protein
LSDAPPATAVVLALADLEDPARCDAAVERLALLLPGLPASSLRTTAALTLARAQVASLDGDGAEAATALLGSDADPTETALLRAEIAALRGQFRTADTLAAEADREGAATAVRGRARALRASVTALAHAVPEAGEEPLLPEGSADASADVRPRAACAATHSERLREAVPTASESVIAAAEAFGEQDLPVEQHAALLRALWFRDDLGDAEAAYVARRERWPESGPVVDCLRGLLLYASGRDKDAARRFRRAARSAEGRSTPDRRLRALVAATGACATGRDDLRSTALAALGGDNWPLAASIREAAERGDADRLDTLAALLPLS